MKKYIFFLLFSFLLLGCASQSYLTPDSSQDIKVKIGMKSCNDCDKVKLIESKKIYSNFFSLDDGRGSYMNFELYFVLTNRISSYFEYGSVGAEADCRQDIRCGNLFEGRYDSGRLYSYRFFLKTRMVGRGVEDRIYIANGDKLQELKAWNISEAERTFIDGTRYNYFFVPAEALNYYIGRNENIKFYVGGHSREMAKSQDGLRPSYKEVSRGFYFEIPEKIAKDFMIKSENIILK